MENVTKALAGAALIYGQPLDADQLRAYLAVFYLSGMADERLAQGVIRACKVCKFFPRPADIIEHAPGTMATTNLLPDGDVEMTTGDRELGKAMIPHLRSWMRGEITRDAYLGRLRWEARKAGVESAINWDEFGDDAPWAVQA